MPSGSLCSDHGIASDGALGDDGYNDEIVDFGMSALGSKVVVCGGHNVQQNVTRSTLIIKKMVEFVTS